MTSPLYIVTGADGFLGSTIVRMLLAQGKQVRAVVLNLQRAEALHDVAVTIVQADVRHVHKLHQAFSADQDRIVIHTAGLISIAAKVEAILHDTNVLGTANVIEACRATGVQRLVYTSSVHAIPEATDHTPVREISVFNQDHVYGAYAKTKAEGTALVQAATDIDRVIVHPSGMLGPGDFGKGHLTQLIRDAMSGGLASIVRGGYDIVDVRDVAAGTIAAAERGRTGESYLLTGHETSVRELTDQVSQLTGVRRPFMMAMWCAKAVVGIAELGYRIRKVPPLFTRYALHQLDAPSVFNHDKATTELNFHPRPIADTVADTVAWISEHPRTRREQQTSRRQKHVFTTVYQPTVDTAPERVPLAPGRRRRTRHLAGR